MYKAIIEECKKHGAFDPATMGFVPNVGFMAQKAKEYGSHPTTFKISYDGIVRVVDTNGKILMENRVDKSSRENGNRHPD